MGSPSVRRRSSRPIGTTSARRREGHIAVRSCSTKMFGMKRFITTITLACAVIVFGPTTVGYAAAPPPVTSDASEVSTVIIAAPVVTIIVSLLIPLVNGVLTKASTPSGVKAVGTIVLNAAWALVANGLLADGTSTFSMGTLYTAVLGCVVSITTYAGLYRPLEVTSNPGGKLAAIGRT